METSKIIDKQINNLKDWRGELLKKLRKIILSTDKELKEEFKWGVPVYTKNGLVCAISAFKDHVKMNFFKGAHLKDNNKLLNAGLDSKDHRAIDFSENFKLNESKIKELVKEAIAFNAPKKK